MAKIMLNGVDYSAPNVSGVTGVKGSNESKYREGNVNLTAEDVGALPGSTKYAASATAGGSATSAEKLNTNAGSVTNPIYFSDGKPVACTYSLGKSVPSDAKFTDTINDELISESEPTTQLVGLFWLQEYE